MCFQHSSTGQSWWKDHESGLVDRQILAELQQDARLTLTELAERVGLSLSPCHRRLRTLERSGVISGYHAHLDANTLGLTFEPNGSSASPTTSCALSPPTCPPSRSSTMSASPLFPASNASPRPSSWNLSSRTDPASVTKTEAVERSVDLADLQGYHEP